MPNIPNALRLNLDEFEGSAKVEKLIDDKVLKNAREISENYGN